MEQNTNRTKFKNTKIQPPYSRPPPLTHWFSIGTPSICILEFLYLGIFAFFSICILFHLYFVAFVFCYICILPICIFIFCILLCLYFVFFVFCHIVFCLGWLYFVLFVLRNHRILSRIHKIYQVKLYKLLWLSIHIQSFTVSCLTILNKQIHSLLCMWNYISGSVK